MKDVYPRLAGLPHEWLVSPEDQPEYLELPGTRLDETTDLGSMLCDVHVRNGMGDAVAVIHHESGRTLTFAELSEVSDRAGAALHALGIRPGDRVALRGANCPELIIASIAAWKIGAVVTLIPALARRAEVEFFLADTQPRLLVLTQPEAEDVLSAVTRSDPAPGSGGCWTAASTEVAGPDRLGRSASGRAHRPGPGCDRMAYRRDDRPTERLLPHPAPVSAGWTLARPGDRGTRR